jgi:hypothetical protein
MRSMGGAITTIMCNLFDEVRDKLASIVADEDAVVVRKTTVMVQCSLKVLYCCLSLKG